MKHVIGTIGCVLAGMSALAGSITDKGDYWLAEGTAASPAEITANTTYNKSFYVGRDGVEGDHDHGWTLDLSL